MAITPAQAEREHEAVVEYAKVSGQLRLIFGVIIAVFLSVVIAYTLMRDNVIAGCWRDDIRTQAIADSLRDIGHPIKAHQIEQAAIVKNCRRAYPPLIPFTK